MPIPNYKKFLLEDPLADTDSSDSDYDPDIDDDSDSDLEEEDNLKEKNEYN